MVRFLLFYLLVMVVASEPECSKFHYEEQTLKKMIRLEIAMEKMEANIAATQRQVVDTVHNLKEEFLQMQADWENEKEITRSDIDQMKDKIDEKLLRNAKELEKMKGPTVAFRSKDLMDLTPSSGKTMVFKTTTLNKGDGYDNTTGIFTAPVDGTYLFTVQFCLDNGRDNYYAIVANNEEIKKGWIGDSSWDKCYTSDATAILQQGGRVWVTCAGGTAKLIQGSNYWNTFSGVCLNH